MSIFLAKSTLEDNFNFTSEINEGFGYSTLYSKPMNTLCTGSLYRPGKSENQKVYFNLQVVENIYEYEKVQSSSFKASGSYGPFGGGGSASFINNLKINSYSCYLIASVTVLNPTQYLNNIKLTQNAISLLDDDEKFYKRFGDSYVNGLIKGGELFIAYEFKSTSKAQQREISSKLNASVKMFNASAEASYKEIVKKLESYTREQIAFYSSAHKQGVALPELKLENLLEYIRQYPIQINNESQNSVLGYELKSISKIDGLVDYPTIINSKELYDQIRKKEYFEDTIENYFDWLRDIKYLNANEEQFPDETIKKANEDENFVNEKIERIKSLLDQVHFTEDFSEFKNLRAKDFECNPALYLRKVPTPPAKPRYVIIRKPRFVIRTPIFKITF